jgi:hypothetical protein
MTEEFDELRASAFAIAYRMLLAHEVLLHGDGGGKRRLSPVSAAPGPHMTIVLVS